MRHPTALCIAAAAPFRNPQLGGPRFGAAVIAGRDSAPRPVAEIRALRLHCRVITRGLVREDRHRTLAVGGGVTRNLADRCRSSLGAMSALTLRAQRSRAVVPSTWWQMRAICRDAPDHGRHGRASTRLGVPPRRVRPVVGSCRQKEVPRLRDSYLGGHVPATDNTRMQQTAWRVIRCLPRRCRGDHTGLGGGSQSWFC